ncbi:MAG: ATP synthase F1 subunit epsilon [Eubacteriales bacterium]
MGENAEFKLHILAADCCFYEGGCTSMIVPTSEGQYGILAHHIDMIAAIAPGELTFTPTGGEKRYAAVSSGLVKIEKNDVMVLCDAIERPEDIDINRARRAADAAREELLQHKSSREYREAQALLSREINRLRVKKHYNDINH